MAATLAAGVVATVATSPAPEPPCPSPSAAVSEFFGAQDEHRSVKEWQPDGRFSVGQFSGEVTHVALPDCVAEHTDDDGRAPVEVTVEVTDHGASLDRTTSHDLESFLQAVRLVDGDGRAHPVTGVVLDDDDGRALLDYALPLDVQEPVVLQVPNLEGLTEVEGLIDEVPLRPDEPEGAFDPEDVETPATQRQQQQP